jgi:hypothetical protein
VPDVGEARLLLEGLSAVSARQIHPAAKDDSVAEVADEGCLNGVWVRGSAGMAYEFYQPGLVCDFAARAEENVVVGDELFQIGAIAFAFLRPVVTLRGAGESGVGEVAVVGLARGCRVVLSGCEE